MPKAYFTVSGDKEIVRKFEQLAPAVAKNIAKPAVKRAAKRFQDAIQANEPVRTGKMRKSTKVKTSKGPRTMKGRLVVAFATVAGQGKANKRQKATGEKIPYYTFMQEKGYHVGVRIRSGGKVTGYRAHSGNTGAKGVRFMPGKFFVKHALKSLEAPVMATLKAELLAGIEAEASRGVSHP